ncbi:hypothetical protein LTS18_012875 [Coniosporium uncinatum]|uniref:Uncharacterized protein n=1 Tax=Coniosporium uncinatum TaxID=93489 RepID=A0ACC3D9B0_9PEZI|nr:hypothetical protein LTS18_012875 [Coniosporium uncinatum]
MALYKAAACSIFVQDAAITANMLYSGVPNMADFIVGSVLVNLLLTPGLCYIASSVCGYAQACNLHATKALIDLIVVHFVLQTMIHAPYFPFLTEFHTKNGRHTTFEALSHAGSMLLLCLLPVVSLFSRYTHASVFTLEQSSSAHGPEDGAPSTTGEAAHRETSQNSPQLHSFPAFTPLLHPRDQGQHFGTFSSPTQNNATAHLSPSPLSFGAASTLSVLAIALTVALAYILIAALPSATEDTASLLSLLALPLVPTLPLRYKLVASTYDHPPAVYPLLLSQLSATIALLYFTLPALNLMDWAYEWSVQPARFDLLQLVTLGLSIEALALRTRRGVLHWMNGGLVLAAWAMLVIGNVIFIVWT